MDNKRSHRHHYLPRHYLKGFTDQNDSFYIYDKLKRKILPGPLTPNSSFLENNLNTVTLPNGDFSDFLENLYAMVEGSSWSAFDTIRSSNSSSAIDILDKMHLYFFLLVLHWRLPSNVAYAEKLSEKLFTDDEDMHFFKLKMDNGAEAPEEMKKLLREFPAMKKAVKLMLPFRPFYRKDWSEQLENWRFLYTGSNESWYLVGDNPLITRGDHDHNPEKCLDEFIFPVSGKIMLISTSEPPTKAPSAEFILQHNLAIIHRAQRFVACQNRDFLEVLVDHYKIYEHFGKEEKVIEDLFNQIKNQ